jgi:hypothetical protein
VKAVVRLADRVIEPAHVGQRLAAIPAKLAQSAFTLAVAAIVLSAWAARRHGWDPESLWKDDLVWGAITRAPSLKSLLAVPAHTSPGFLTILWGSRALFRDPEWSLQLLPFICGLAAIPVVALMVRRLTRSDGLGVLAAALTALNPLLAHYTVFVKEYSLGFLATAGILWAAASRFDDPEPNGKLFFRTSLAAGVLVFFSITSVFASMPVINLIALRSLRQKRESVRSVIASAAIYDLLVLAAFHTMRSRTNEIVAADFQYGFARTYSLSAFWQFVSTRGRHLIEASFPAWGETTMGLPALATSALPVVGLGLICLFLAAPRRWFGLAVVGFYAAFLLASALHAYPMGMGRPDIFALPVAITLFALGIERLTAWLPRPELARLAAGIVVAGFALVRPVHAGYWAVDDARLIHRLSAEAADRDGVIISADGSYLVAHYGTWPVRISAASDVSNATSAKIERDRTLYVVEERKPDRSVERLVDTEHPERIWYVAFRTKGFNRVATSLLRRGYDLQRIEQTSKGALYLATNDQPAASNSPVFPDR